MNILFIGAGKMGGAILSGIGSDNNIVVIEPDFLRTLQIKNVKVFKEISELPPEFIPDVIFLAVKPWIIKEVASNLKKFKNAIIISIAAGKKIEFIEEIFENNKQKVVRAMPNLAATIKKSVTALSYNKNVNDDDKKTCVLLLSEIGKVIEVPENKMDFITAVSGSGPAYLFRFVEAMQKAILKHGFNKEDSFLIANEVICGASELLSKSIKNAVELKNDVTTPNGTTQAALEVFDLSIDDMVLTAIDAAHKRSVEISQN